MIVEKIRIVVTGGNGSLGGGTGGIGKPARITRFSVSKTVLGCYDAFGGRSL